MADADFEYLPAAAATMETNGGGPKAPLDMSHHFSRVTMNRKESRMKAFYKYFQIAGIGNLAGGKYLAELRIPCYINV